VEISSKSSFSFYRDAVSQSITSENWAPHLLVLQFLLKSCLLLVKGAEFVDLLLVLTADLDFFAACRGLVLFRELPFIRDALKRSSAEMKYHSTLHVSCS